MPPRKLCSRCLKPLANCYCFSIHCINNLWPVTILQHPQEAKHAIGTARIAQLSLQLCSTLLSNNAEHLEQLSLLVENQSPLLVYPGESSIDLSELKNTNPKPLLFIDASWRKSRRLFHEIPQLNQLPKISFKPDTPSRYRIRKQPNAHSLSTLEAIVTTLTNLEKNQQYQSLLTTMDWMIEQQVKAMGEKTFNNNY